MKNTKKIISMIDSEEAINKINLAAKNHHCTVKYQIYEDTIKAFISNGYILKIFRIDSINIRYFAISPENNLLELEAGNIEEFTDILSSMFEGPGAHARKIAKIERLLAELKDVI